VRAKTAELPNMPPWGTFVTNGLLNGSTWGKSPGSNIKIFATTLKEMNVLKAACKVI